MRPVVLLQRTRDGLGGATGELARRRSLVLERDEPDATNTGVLGSTRPLTVFDGNITVTTAGTVLEDLDIRGIVDVRAPDVTIRNTAVRGSTTLPSGVRGLVHCVNSAVARLTLEDVLLEPQRPSWHWNGVMGHDYTAKRVLTRQTTDGFRIFNQAAPSLASGVSLLGCWVDRLRYWRDDPDQTDGSHGDCVQIQSCHSTLVQGSRLDAYLAPGSEQRYLASGELPGVTQALSAVMLNNDMSAQRISVDLLGNWIRGGDQPVNGGSSKLAGMDLGRAWRNRHDRGARIAGHTIDLDSQVVMDTGDGTPNQNVYEDNGAPVVVRRNQ